MRTFIIAATSADGFLGTDAGHRSFEWTSPEDKARFRNLTKRAGLIIVGSRTYDTFPPKFRPLPNRRNVVYSRQAGKYIGPGVETTSEDPRALLDRLAAEGHGQAAIIGGGEIYRMFLDAGLVDEIRLTVEPIKFGSGIPFSAGDLTKRFRLESDQSLGGGTIFRDYARKS